MFRIRNKVCSVRANSQEKPWLSAESAGHGQKVQLAAGGRLGVGMLLQTQGDRTGCADRRAVSPGVVRLALAWAPDALIERPAYTSASTTWASQWPLRLH